MSRLNVAPTKSSLLSLQRDLSVANEGYQLLDQKREILVMELMVLLDRARELDRRIREAEAKAMASLRRALLFCGREGLQRAAAGVVYSHRVKAENRTVAGVRVPHITMTAAALTPQFTLAGTSVHLDAVMSDFLELTKLSLELAELQTAASLLGVELKKTQRRVNALEQIFIPDFRETLKFVRDVLEGKEMEGIFAVKKVKRRLESRVVEQTPV